MYLRALKPGPYDFFKLLFLQYGQHMVRLEMVAEDYCAAILVKKYFNKWQDYITTEQILYWEKERKADEHSDW